MTTSALSESELTTATLAELFERSKRGAKLHCFGTVATALGCLGIVASLDDEVGEWRRIAVWAGLVLLAAAALWWALVVHRVLPRKAATVDRTLVVCALNGLLVGSVGWFDLDAMAHQSFAYALCAATLAYCAGTLVNLHPLSVLIGASIVPAVVSLSLSLFVSGNIVPGVCALVVLGIFAQALPPMRRLVDELVRTRLIAQHASAHDSLTGVRNRLGLQSSLAATRGLVYGDIDGFKQINDRYGHMIGDSVIAELASRLQQVADSHGAIVARLGGDEFVITTDRPGARPTTALADDITHAMAQPFGTVGEVRFSVGTATRHEDSADSLRLLFVEADHALYRAKRAHHSHDGDAEQSRLPDRFDWVGADSSLDDTVRAATSDS